MFISPHSAIESRWIVFPDYMTETEQQECIQPNAIDFTIDHVNKLATDQPATIHRSGKILKQGDPLSFAPDTLQHLPQGTYDFTSAFYLNLPEGVAALIIPRSTFVRAGCFIVSGLWDSGFQGHLGGALHVQNPLGVTIEPRTRIGQVIFVASASVGTYAGGYNSAVGSTWGGQPIQLHAS